MHSKKKIFLNAHLCIIWLLFCITLWSLCLSFCLFFVYEIILRSFVQLFNKKVKSHFIQRLYSGRPVWKSMPTITLWPWSGEQQLEGHSWICSQSGDTFQSWHCLEAESAFIILIQPVAPLMICRTGHCFPISRLLYVAWLPDWTLPACSFPASGWMFWTKMSTCDASRRRQVWLSHRHMTEPERCVGAERKVKMKDR